MFNAFNSKQPLHSVHAHPFSIPAKNIEAKYNYIQIVQVDIINVRPFSKEISQTHPKLKRIPQTYRETQPA